MKTSFSLIFINIGFACSVKSCFQQYSLSNVKIIWEGEGVSGGWCGTNIQETDKVGIEIENEWTSG